MWHDGSPPPMGFQCRVAFLRHAGATECESFWSSEWAIREILPGKRAVSPPLGLATLAALCPTNWQIEIVDENVEPVPLEPQADIVGVCGMAGGPRRVWHFLRSVPPRSRIESGTRQIRKQV